MCLGFVRLAWFQLNASVHNHFGVGETQPGSSSRHQNDDQGLDSWALPSSHCQTRHTESSKKASSPSHIVLLLTSCKNNQRLVLVGERRSAFIRLQLKNLLIL
jgi:hypothetical protein